MLKPHFWHFALFSSFCVPQFGQNTQLPPLDRIDLLRGGAAEAYIVQALCSSKLADKVVFDQVVGGPRPGGHLDNHSKFLAQLGVSRNNPLARVDLTSVFGGHYRSLASCSVSSDRAAHESRAVSSRQRSPQRNPSWHLASTRSKASSSNRSLLAIRSNKRRSRVSMEQLTLCQRKEL